MDVLHVLTTDGHRRVPLTRSLRRQTDRRWRMGSVGTAEPSGPSEAVVHLDHDTRLRPDAVEAFLSALEERPDAAAVFADAVVDGRRLRRPAWSPTRAWSEPGAQYPMVRRGGAVLRPDSTVLQIPAPLSSHPTPPVAVDRLLDPVGPLDPGPRPGTHRLRPDPSPPSLSVIVPTAAMRRRAGGPPLVEACLASLATVRVRPHEILMVVGDEFEGDPMNMTFPGRLTGRVVHRGPGPFDFARAVNAGLLAASGEHVLLLNDDVEWSDADGPARMAAHLHDPTVGAVGALLTYPDGTVQHAGLVIDDARPLHPFVGWPVDATASHGGDVARDVVAVTGACLMARRADLLALGGMSRRFPLSFNDADLCLRLRRCGFRVVIEPAATAVHRESASRAPRIDPWEWDRWIRRWGEVVDPWYHPGHHRPDDPAELRRNVDHLDGPAWESPVPRDTAIRPRVHHARIPPDSVA